MIKVSILGATGYTGYELVKILSRHPHVHITHLVSETSAGETISSLYPALYRICDLVLENINYDNIAADSDAVFLCLPHAASMTAAAELRKRNKIVFDLSADFRIKDKKLYEDTYKIEHTESELLKESVYGLAEVFNDELSAANLVAVPGCYPTSALIPLIPLIKNNLIDTDHIIIDSKSGVSGAGKKATATTHFCEVNEDFKPYGVFTHRHKPEIDHIINRVTGVKTDVVFTPHLLPLTRGMLSTIYTRSNVSVQKLIEVLEDAYHAKKFIRVINSMPAIKNVANTNFIDINVSKKGNNVIIVSAIDNLLKGASGQAVQCFNARMNLPANLGLI